MEITIKTCKLKREGTGKNGKPYKIFNIQDVDGKWYDSFDEFQEGEVVDVEIKENGQYNPNIKRMKAVDLISKRLDDLEARIKILEVSDLPFN